MSTETAPAGVSRLQHDEREWCRRMQAGNRLDPLMVTSIVEALDQAAREAGAPLERTYERRWNAKGTPIGPDMRISTETAYFIAYACEKVRDAIDEAVTNMLGRSGDHGPENEVTS